MSYGNDEVGQAMAMRILGALLVVLSVIEFGIGGSVYGALANVHLGAWWAAICTFIAGVCGCISNNRGTVIAGSVFSVFGVIIAIVGAIVDGIATGVIAAEKACQSMDNGKIYGDIGQSYNLGVCNYSLYADAKVKAGIDTLTSAVMKAKDMATQYFNNYYYNHPYQNFYYHNHHNYFNYHNNFYEWYAYFYGNGNSNYNYYYYNHPYQNYYYHNHHNSYNYHNSYYEMYAYFYGNNNYYHNHPYQYFYYHNNHNNYHNNFYEWYAYFYGNGNYNYNYYDNHPYQNYHYHNNHNPFYYHNNYYEANNYFYNHHTYYDNHPYQNYYYHNHHNNYINSYYEANANNYNYYNNPYDLGFDCVCTDNALCFGYTLGTLSDCGEILTTYTSLLSGSTAIVTLLCVICFIYSIFTCISCCTSGPSPTVVPVAGVQMVSHVHVPVETVSTQPQSISGAAGQSGVPMGQPVMYTPQYVTPGQPFQYAPVGQPYTYAPAGYAQPVQYAPVGAAPQSQYAPMGQPQYAPIGQPQQPSQMMYTPQYTPVYQPQYGSASVAPLAAPLGASVAPGSNFGADK